MIGQLRPPRSAEGLFLVDTHYLGGEDVRCVCVILFGDYFATCNPHMAFRRGRSVNCLLAAHALHPIETRIVHQETRLDYFV